MDKIRKIISLFFVELFASYYAGTTLFSHTHIIRGATIVHSHIHTHSHHDSKSGNHTEQSITLIALSSHFEFADLSCNCVLKPSQSLLHKEKTVETTHWFVSIHLENLTLRAPPVLT